jgi:hypothetical protein
MGYDTSFSGEFSIVPALTAEQTAYLQAFTETRRVKRNPEMLVDVPDHVRAAVGLPLGVDAEYFVGYPANFGQSYTPDVVDDTPPTTQPGLWCQWIPTDKGDQLVWDEGEKFYDYEDWLQYLIDNFFKPWDRVLNGEVYWIGEDPDDRGVLVVENNVLTVKHGRVIYE